MYPTLVLVLIKTQRSMTDVCEVGSLNASKPAAGPAVSQARSTTLGPLSFALGPMHSTTDDDAESQRSRALQSQGEQEHESEEDILEPIPSAPTLHPIQVDHLHM